MAFTFKALATTTVGSGGASSITFSSIPSGYTDLVVLASFRHDQTIGDFRVRFNGDTGSNYSRRWLQGDGSNASSNNASGNDGFYWNAVSDRSNYTANTFSNFQMYIPNYTSSNYKSVSVDTVIENNATAAVMWMVASLWSSTSAITSITLEPNDGGTAANLVQYSKATLYGIRSS